MWKYENGADVSGADPSQPLVVLLGNSAHFSDQMLRLLRLEFDGVCFDRLCDTRDLPNLQADPEVFIIHGMDPKLEVRLEEVRAKFPDARIAVACSDEVAMRRKNQIGPSSPVCVLNMNAQFDVWLSVLRLLLCGHVYVPIDLLQEVRAEPDLPPEIRLTPRELEILALIAEGKQNKTIAAELGLSGHTVKLHTHNIFSKLRVSNRTGAAKWYLSQVEA